MPLATAEPCQRTARGDAGQLLSDGPIHSAKWPLCAGNIILRRKPTDRASLPTCYDALVSSNGVRRTYYRRDCYRRVVVGSTWKRGRLLVAYVACGCFGNDRPALARCLELGVSVRSSIRGAERLIVVESRHLASNDVATLAGSLNEALATNPSDGLDGRRLLIRSAEGLLSSAIDMGSPAKLRPR